MTSTATSVVVVVVMQTAVGAVRWQCPRWKQRVVVVLMVMVMVLLWMS